MIAETQHDRQASGDYALLKGIGINTVRDGVRWHLIEKNGKYDFTSLSPMIEAAEKNNMQVIWTLCHYGWPEYADPFSVDFPKRFADFCHATAQEVRRHSDKTPFYTPVNEISYLASMAGDAGAFSPFQTGRGHELKVNLVHAAIAGMDAVRDVDARARFVHVDPLLNIIPAQSCPDHVNEAEHARLSQFEAFDMLFGKMHPELGGSPGYLDIVGLNYYATNQWEHFGDRIHWHEKPRDPRWKPLHKMIEEVCHRYNRPVMLGETSHVGVGRAEWMREITDEVAKLDPRLPFVGICLYPAIDRTCWVNREHWHNSGIFDYEHLPCGTFQRVAKADYVDEIRRAQIMFGDRPALLGGRAAQPVMG